MDMKKGIVVFTLLCAASAVVGALAGSFVVEKRLSEQSAQYAERSFEQPQTATAQFAAYTPENYPDLTFAAETAVRAVVNIEAITEIDVASMNHFNPFFEFFGFPQGPQQQGAPQKREQRSGGSGVIISPDGYIVTNNHVVERATKLRVKLNDGRKFDARIIGRDPATDVALIKIDAEGLPTLQFGSSDDLRLGEWVLAIGSPFDLQSTITAGIVSAKARALDVIPSEFRIESFIQTDAAVNPGNSGGALVNTRGELVGINTVIKSSTGSYVGYSFAVPESIVRKVVVDLKEYGLVQRALLGITYAYIDQDFIDNMGKDAGVSEVGGVYVASVVEGGAASEAGLRKGDVITEIDGVRIESARAMNMGMEALKPYLLQENAKPAGKVVIGTVKGDLHDIGKNLVKLMMESKGFEVIDAGVDVSAEQFVEKAIETEANIISCSALLTTTMLEMRRVVEVAEEKGVRNRIKIIIGGAPVTQKFCDEIGADGYTTDAVSAAELALELVK